MSTLAPRDTPSKLTLKKSFAAMLNEEVANGHASADTVRTYTQQFKLFLQWCDRCGLKLEEVSRARIKAYRRYLVDKGLSVATIALKLTVVRRIFAIAVERGLMGFNPALGVKPPTESVDPAEKNNYLDRHEAIKLIDSLPLDNTVKGLRDRLLVCLMVVQGCRQIGLYRLNVGDIIRRGDKKGLRIRAKGKVRVVPLTDDVRALLDRYLKARKAAGEKLRSCAPMFISLALNSVDGRLTRRSMERIVNGYLEAAELKYNEERTVTTHGLRHTVGYLLTLAGKPLRVIQDFLGHRDPRTTAIYAHIVNLWEHNPANSLGLAV